MALTSRMEKGIALMLEGNKSNAQIAKEAGVSENTVYNWLKNDDFLAELQKQQRRVFTRLACKAQRKMEELIDSPNPSIAFAASKEILNKAGLDVPLKIEAEVEGRVIFEGEDAIAD